MNLFFLKSLFGSKESQQQEDRSPLLQNCVVKKSLFENCLNIRHYRAKVTRKSPHALAIVNCSLSIVR